MPQLLSDDEFNSQFGGGFRAAPSPVGMSGRFGAAVDRTQASLLGIGEAAGLPLGGLRRENQAEADASTQRYYRETGAPRSFSEVQGAGDFGSYVAGLAVDSAPAMVGIAAGGLAGGVPGAFAVGSALGTGDVLDNQREQAGETNLGTALPLGIAYGAADAMLGVGGMLARRSLGTGIRSLDRAGVNLLDGLTGVKGVAARTGVQALKTGAVESGSETFQEGMNQLGRMSVDQDETFYNERSAENFKESAIGGGLLGGLMGGAAGGWRRSAGYQAPIQEGEQRDLLLSGLQGPSRELVGPQPQQNWVPELEGPTQLPVGPQPQPNWTPEMEGPGQELVGPRAFEQATNPIMVDSNGTAMAGPNARELATEDPGTQLARQRWEAQRVQAQELQEEARRQQAEKARIESFGVTAKGDNHRLFKELEALRDLGPENGGITPAQFTDNAAKLVGENPVDRNGTRKFLKEVASAQQPQAPKAERKSPAPTAREVEIANDTPAPPVPNQPAAPVQTAQAATETVAPVDSKAVVAKVREDAAKANEARKAKKLEVEALASTSAPKVVVAEAETVGGVPVKKVEYVDPKAAVTKVDLDEDSRTPVEVHDHVKKLLGTSLKGTPKFASYEAFKQRLMLASGYEADTAEDGSVVLRQVNNPMSMSEVADKEGVSRAAVSKQFLGYGIGDSTINKLAYNEADVKAESAVDDEYNATSDSASDTTVSADKAIEGTNLVAHGSLAKAAGDNIVEAGGVAATPEQREAEKAAAELLKKAPKETAEQPTEQDLAFEAKRKAAAEAAVMRELGYWLRTGDGRHVQQWWDDRARGTGINFESMSDADQLSWALGVFKLHTSGNLTDGKFDTLYKSIAGTTAARAEVQTGEPSSTSAPVEDGGGRGDAPTRVGPTVVKKRSVAVPTAEETQAPVAAPTKGKLGLKPKVNADMAKPDLPFNAEVVSTDVGESSDPLARFRTLFGKAKQGAKPTLASVQKLVDSLIPVLKSGLDITVSKNPVEAGVAASLPSGFNPPGAVIDGRLYLFSDNIVSDFDAKVTLFHELFHMGLQKVLAPQDFAALLKPFVADPQVAKYMREWRGSTDGKDRAAKLNSAAVDAIAVEEALARIGEDLTANEGAGTRFSTLARPFLNFAANVATKLRMHDLAAAIRVFSQNGAERFVVDMVNAAMGGPTSLAGKQQSYTAQAQRNDVSPRFRTEPQTMQQFSDSLPGRVSDLWDSFKTLTDEVSVKAMFTEDLINAASKVLPSAAKYLRAMSDIQIERGKAERVVADVVEDFRALPAHERGMGDKSVNAFIKKSTMTGKWAFTPDWVPGAVADPDLKADFERSLSPKAQELVKRVFRRGHESLVEMQTAAVANADSEYNALIAEATKAGDAKEVASLTQAKAKSLKDFQGLLAIHKGTPYAPLKRFGNYVVMAVSQEYKAASEAGNTKAMQEMQRNGDHYHIEFTDTNREARARARSLESAFPGGFVGKMEKGDDGLMMGGRDMLGAFGRLRKVMADSVVDNPNVDKATGKRIDDMMRQLYLTLLSETSARKGEIHRKNVAGANDDMMRSFATQGRATAHFIAGLKTSGKVDDHLATMRNETKALNSGREERTRYYNEIIRRHSMGLEYKPSPMIDQAMATTSAMMLLTNPSYHLMNALQPGMMTIPLLAGRHGYAKSWSALTRAYTELGPILKAREFTEKSYDSLPADVKKAIEDLANMGKIDIMMDADLGRVESASDSKVKRPFVVASEWLKGISQDVESMNRLSSAIAAYRLEKGRPGATHQSAVDYASKVIYETHGDYSGFNAPRFMRSGIGRLATQFKKFQLIQISMFARLASRSWRDDPSMTPAQNAEAKIAARYALTYTLAHLLAMGGVMGLPGFAAIAWVVGKVWPGDDEPDDPEATLRRAIGNEALADFLLQGAPSSMGVNVSGRIGAGGMLSLLPYTDVELSRKSYPEMVTAAMGPFIGGVLPRALGGLELMAKGEVIKGTEALLPNGMGNAVKSVRFGVDGVSKGNGDTLMPANDINALDIIGQAFGLPPTKITDRMTDTSSQYKAEQFYKDRTGELKQRYTKAVKANDADTMRDLRAKWADTQAARKNLGFQPSPLSDLLKAPQEQRKREAATQGGVQYNKGNRGFVEALQ